MTYHKGMSRPTHRTPLAVAQAGTPDAAFSSTTSALLLGLMIFLMLLPIFPNIGGLRWDPHRVFFLLAILPFGFFLLSGRAGRMTISDGLMLFVSAWMILTYVYHHGLERLPYAVVVTSEMLGGYLAGRLLIRSAQDYRRFIGYLFLSLLIMLPFAVFELFTFRAPILEALGKFFLTQAKYLDARTSFNLSRVQVVFPHAILFGLYCSFILGNVYYLYGPGLLRKVPRIALVSGMSWMSLSSAAILSLGFQFVMILWDMVMRRRWKLLLGIIAFIYTFLSIFSNRGPIILMIEYLTLNPRTAWWRVHIWNFGTASVRNHPFFGIGLNAWERPDWLAGTVDNFWLVLTMRHGLPLIICFGLAIAIHILRIVRQRDLDVDLSAVRTGYMVSLIGLILTLATVHVWNALAALVTFYIGAGAFLYTRREGVQKAEDETPATVGTSSSPPPGNPYSRFAIRKGRRGQAPQEPAQRLRIP